MGMFSADEQGDYSYIVVRQSNELLSAAGQILEEGFTESDHLKIIHIIKWLKSAPVKDCGNSVSPMFNPK
jgi:hypothetical protein